MTEYDFHTGNLCVTVLIDFYEVENHYATGGLRSSVTVPYVFDVIHKGESIGALISEETAEEILNDYKKELERQNQ